VRDFTSLDHKVECAKCGRKLPYFELEKGVCLRCRRLEEQIKKEDKLLWETVKKTNDSLKSIPCPFCGRFSISYWAYYVRRPGITSYVEESYMCSYWRCKAKGLSLSTMQQKTGLFVRMLNKIFPPR